MTSLTAILIATGTLALVIGGLTIWNYGLPWCPRHTKRRPRDKSSDRSSHDEDPDER